MTISSSLNAGVAGLTANATRLASISDNIANASTFGYKRVETDFASLASPSQGGSYSAGGVRATTTRLISESSTLISTSNSTDLAVRGRGMIPVASMNEVSQGNGTPTMQLSTTGSFRPDSDGYLVSNTGQVLLGWPANPDGTIPSFPRDTGAGLEPVQINLNGFTAEPTTSVDIAVNLPATDAVVGPAGPPRTLSVEYFDNLGLSQTLNVAFTATGVNANEWTMTVEDTATAPASNPIGTYTLTFNDSRTAGGTLNAVAPIADYDAATGEIIVNVGGGPMALNIGLPGDPNGMSQLSDTFAPVVIAKDGSPLGNMISVEVDEGGFVRALFDTGISRTVYQIPLVDLPNPNGMLTQDFQTYLPTFESGPFFLWNAGDGPTGEVVSFAREESATDVAGELTDMIQTQRAYSTNAKVIQTVDEMLQETTNIKR